MMRQIGPTTRQRIIDHVHRSGIYRAEHFGLQVRMELHLINGKSHIGLAVCQDRKWRNYTVENGFAAVEQVNAILLEKTQRRSVVQNQLNLAGGAEIQLD